MKDSQTNLPKVEAPPVTTFLNKSCFSDALQELYARIIREKGQFSRDIGGELYKVYQQAYFILENDERETLRAIRDPDEFVETLKKMLPRERINKLPEDSSLSIMAFTRRDRQYPHTHIVNPYGPPSDSIPEDLSAEEKAKKRLYEKRLLLVFSNGDMVADQQIGSEQVVSYVCNAGTSRLVIVQGDKIHNFSVRPSDVFPKVTEPLAIVGSFHPGDSIFTSGFPWLANYRPSNRKWRGPMEDNTQLCYVNLENVGEVAFDDKGKMLRFPTGLSDEQRRDVLVEVMLEQLKTIWNYGYAAFDRNGDVSVEGLKKLSVRCHQASIDLINERYEIPSLAREFKGMIDR